VPPSRATRQGCRLRKLFWNISQKRENISLTSGVRKIG
jgi:hypothetical protein